MKEFDFERKKNILRNKLSAILQLRYFYNRNEMELKFLHKFNTSQ